ncbi:MAG: hypothetical protein H6587_04310 [Flavobacteriales bacterium]|nr:hypothetical protein [Flavobacteriales bacterium]MCB9363772.1 hypothetical protein [Flavobacteriales bacterium]MCB9500258.1 hypothetical protein [Erysipelotrichaceae bacterium]
MKNKILVLNLMLTIIVFIGCNNSNTTDEIQHLLDGENRIEYYDNGNIKHDGFESKGQYEGIHIWYYQNGQKEIVAEYLDGLLDGYYEDYYENGQLKSHGNLMRNFKDGKWKYYTETGFHYSDEIIEYKDKSKFLHTTNYNSIGVKEEMYFKDDFLFYAEIFNDNGDFINIGINPLTINNQNNDTLYVKGLDSLHFIFPAYYGKSTPIKVRFHDITEDASVDNAMKTDFNDYFPVPKNGELTIVNTITSSGTYYLHGIYFWEYNKLIKGGTKFSKVLIFK